MFVECLHILLEIFNKKKQKTTKLFFIDLQINLEIQCRMQDKETRDITHLDVLGNKQIFFQQIHEVVITLKTSFREAYRSHCTVGWMIGWLVVEFLT